MDFFVKSFIQFSSPFSISKLEEIRLHILQEMIDKGFSHYMKQMKDLIEQMNVLLNHTPQTDLDAVAMNDTYWEQNGMKTSYWEDESPWLSKLYHSFNIGMLSQTHEAGVTSAVARKLDRNLIRQFLGDPFWMTAQQKILFRAIIISYYKNNKRLWPINLNIDYVFLKTLRRLEETEPEPEPEPELYEENEEEKSPSPKKPDNTIVRLVQSALAGSGPFILKVLQQVNTSNKAVIHGVHVSEITKDVFSKIPGLTPTEVQLVRENLGVDPVYVQNMDPNLLGSASISEAHLTHNADGYKGVIKFIKPIYAYFFLCEMNFMLTSVWQELQHEALQETSDPDMQKLYVLQTRKFLMFIMGEFVKEFDYASEWKNTVLGYEIYNRPQKNIRSIVAMDFNEDPLPGIVLQYVEGRSLDSLLNQEAENYPPSFWADLYQTVLRLNDIWYTETLWGSGFAHTDIHPGNVIWTDQHELYLIDFGSAVTLSPTTQCLMIDAMYISGFIRPLDDEEKKTNYISWLNKTKKQKHMIRKFVEKIWDICKVNYYTKKHLDRITLDIQQHSQKWFSDMFLYIVEYSNDIGSCIHSDVLMFGRGVAYLTNIIMKILSKNPNLPPFHVDKIVQKNLLKHPQQLTRLLMGKSTCRK